MQPFRRVRALLLVVFVLAGVVVLSRYFSQRAVSPSREGPSSPAEKAEVTNGGDSSSANTSSAARPGGAVAPAASAPAAGDAATAGNAIAQEPNPLPPVTVPYEIEPEIDLSTHYAIVKGHRAHPYKLLAKYKAGAAAAARRDALDSLKLRSQSQFPLTPDMVVIKPVTPADALVTSAQEAEVLGNELLRRADALLLTGQFEYVEPDYIVSINATPSDQAFTDGTLWGLRNTGQSGGLSGADIGAVDAWDTTTGSTSVIVAVIDTGVRYTHQDLTAQMWRNPDEIAGNGVDDDQDGYVDNVYGINGITNSGNPMDDNNHGTHCAGTIGAQANGGGPIVGVAWSVKIMACKFLSSSGNGSISDAIKCINFATLKGANVMSNSWGGGPFTQALADAITAANASGVLFVAAAGNDSSNNDAFATYPASYTHGNILSVAALNRLDQLAYFSNYGAASVDIGAPGESIYSSTAASDTSYGSFSGTSMATPHVAGVAALVLARAPDISVADLRQRIFSGAVAIPALTGKCVTGGRLNAHNALTGESDGELEVSVIPTSGAEVTGGATIPVYVYVRDFTMVTDATVTGTAGGSTSVTFSNNGTGLDSVANDNVYTGSITLPSSGTSFTLQVQVSAPDKTSKTVDCTYAIRQPPANDAFAQRITLSGSLSTVTGHNIGATRENGEPIHHTPSAGGKSVWWTWTAPSNGTVTFHTNGSAFDTLLAVYTGTAVNALTMKASDDDSGDFLGSLVSFSVISGTTYQIAVDGFGSGTGNISLTTSFIAAPVPPVNDNFSAASVLTGADVAATGNNLIATKESGEPNHAGNSGGRSVWWSWTAPSTGVATVTTDGSLFDTTLGVYTGTAVNALTMVASDNDSGEGTRSQASFGAVAGTTYRIAIDGFSGTSGTIALALSLVTSAPAPANDQFASATTITLSGSSATVTGTNIGATKETGEPSHVQNSGGHSVWWTWTAPSDGSVIINTTGSNFDTLLAVYTGAAVNALTEVASNDQDPTQTTGARTSRVQFNVTSGTTYRIVVDGLSDGLNTALGSITLNFTLSTIVLPPNDLFALRTVVSTDSATVTGSNIGATAETGEPYHYSTANKSVWWSWTAPTTGQVLMRARGTEFTPVLAIYRGTDLPALTQVGYAYSSSGGAYTTYLYFAATAGVTYQIAVDSLSSYSTGGTFTLDINMAIPTPVIVTQPAAQNRYPGDSIYLYVQAEYSPVQLSYRWKKNGVALIDGGRVWGTLGAYLTIDRAEVGDTGSYTVEVTNTAGTTISSAAAISVTVPPPPVISYQPASQSVYLGETIFLNVSAPITGNTTYQWQRSTDNGATFTNIPNATYSSFWIYTSQPGDFVAYRVLVTNPGGTTASNTAVITPLTPMAPVFSAHPGSVTVQGGSSFYLNGWATGRGNITYRWQKDGVDLANENNHIYGATSSNLSVNNTLLSDAGQYRLVATNAGGSATSNSATVTVTTPPAPVIYGQPSPQTVTAGYGTNFYVNASGAGLRYQWQRNEVNLTNDARINGANNASLYIGNVRASDAGQYRVIVSNEGGTVTSNAVTLTVNLPPPPVFYTQPSGLTTVEGSSFSLHGFASGQGMLTYQWYRDDVPIEGASSPYYSRTAAVSSDAGKYKLAATNGGGTVFSREVDVMVIPGTPPAFVVQPVSTTVEEGMGVTLFASATGVPAPTYQWFKNDILIPNQTSTSLTFLAEAADNGATFKARATNALGSTDSATATITIHTMGSGRVLDLGPASRTVGAGRVVYPLTIRTNGAWTAVKSAPWILLSASSGDGNRTLEVTVAPNPLPVDRTATITIGDKVHTLSQRAAGTPVRELWSMGDNTSGQLGDGSLPSSAFPMYMGSGYAAVAAAAERSFVLKTDGTLFATGDNLYGELGDGTTVVKRAQVQVATSVASVHCGYRHTFILKTDGTLFACGLNTAGQLGVGGGGNRSTPVQVATGVRAVAAGNAHSLILKNDGTLWSCGFNSDGQLGDGTSTNRSTPVQIASDVVSIAAGASHSLFVKSDGGVWACGSNIYSQFGTGRTSNDTLTPIQVATGMKAVAASGDSSFFLKADDTLWACGRNSYGQLGDGNNYTRYAPAQVASGVLSVASGPEHTAILKIDGTLWACGDNLNCELGDGSTTNRFVLVRVATGVAAAAVGDDHTSFVKTNGTLWMVGSNFLGQLGQGSAAVTARFTPINIASDVSSVSAGQNHSAYVKTDGTVWTVGANFYGQLADGSLNSRTTPVSVMSAGSAVGAGARHSLILKNTGALLSAGGNEQGQLGDGTGAQRASPLTIATDVDAISAGSGHSLARKTGNALIGFGSNYNGQLGSSDTSLYPTPVTVFNNGGGTVYAGGGHSLFVKSDGTLWVAGQNYYGQLGNGSYSAVYTPAQITGSYRAAAAGAAHSLFLLSDGVVRATGSNSRGQLGDGSQFSRAAPTQVATGARAVAAGSVHSFVLKDDKSLWGFGDNSSGQLGVAAPSSSYSPLRVAANVEEVAAGTGHTLFIASADPRPSGYTAPAITGFSPATPAAGATVTLSGTGFTDVLGVYFNNVAATSYTVVSPTQITAVAPDANLANVTITVGTFDGVAIQNNATPPAPSGGGSTPPAGGGGGGGGGGSPSVWYFALLVVTAGARCLSGRRRH